MQQQHHLQERSPLAFLILAGLVEESKRATALHEAAMQAGGQVIEPGAFSRVMARMEQRGWIVSYEGEEGLHRYHLTDVVACVAWVLPAILRLVACDAHCCVRA
jgi:DNA-binding MarR family transcriptional regulator